MIIKKYTCKRFAGIKDIDMEFENGLNVILGSNEAGKSTVVEGIHSVLFKASKVGRRAADDVYFRNKFMPISSGDSIDGELYLRLEDGDYRIKKEWGVDPSSQMMTPASDIIRDEESIREMLKDLLLFGESTYNSIFFSKQVSFKDSIQNIINNKDTTSEISSLLRRAIMELDGVSLDKLQEKIDSNLDALYSRWDIDKNYPENNRGINNPYKVGVGRILETFYKKESLRLEIDKANENEKHYNDICNKLKITESRISQLKEKKDLMEDLENDVTQRLILEPKLLKLDSDMDILKKVNSDWPKNQQRLEQINEELKNLTEDLTKLNEEKNKVKSLVEKNQLIGNLSKANDLKAKIDKDEKEILSIKEVNKSHIQELEKNQENMIKIEAMLDAGVIIGQFNYFNGDKKVIVTKGFDESFELTQGQVFRGDGYVKVEAEGLFELELKAGDLDFKDLRSKFEDYKERNQEILKDLEVKDINEAKGNRERFEKLKGSILGLKGQVDELLNGLTIEELEAKIEAIGDLGQVRDLEIIEAEINKLNSRNLELASDNKLLESNIEDWTSKYGDLDGLFDKTIEIRMEQKQVKDQLDKLKPLPDEYQSAEDFRNKLGEIREEFERLQESVGTLRNAHFEAERNLSEWSLEELSEDLEAEEALFKKRLNEGKRLLKIKEAFNKTKAKMDESSFTPVVQMFSNYIKILTNGNYKDSNIDNDFNLRLEKDSNTIIPLDLLSSGTYDSVALALRLSILDYILGDRKGFLILDDCLVDLDPIRKERAAKLIGDFASKHQVIFTTCSPDTAQLLGGNLIQM